VKYELNDKNYEARIVPINNHRVLTIVRDISENKKLEKELETKELQNRAILKAIPDLMFVLNRQGVYQDVYAQNSSQFIMPKEKLMGKTIYDVLPKGVYEKIIMTIDKAVKHKTPQTLEYSITINDELNYFEARIVLKENGNFLVIARDVTDDMRNQIVLKESEERFRLAMLATHDGFYDFNPETKLGWYNQKYIDLFKPTNEKNGGKITFTRQIKKECLKP